MKASLFLFLVLSGVAWAQEGDEPIPYEPLAEEPPSSVDSERRREGAVPSLASADDPNLGMTMEWLSGLWLQDGAQGAGVEPLFGFGARVGWALGRALSSEEDARRRFWLDFTWCSAFRQEGTLAVSTQSQYHFFSLAPAFVWGLVDEGALDMLFQAGGGVALQSSLLQVSGEAHQISGLKPLLQYGVGLRSTPRLTGDGSLRLSLRLDVTRFRRGYLDDTLFAASLGLMF